MADYVLVDTLPKLRKVAQSLARSGKRVALDTETTGFSPLSNRLISVQMMQEGKPPVIVDWRNATDEWAEPLQEIVQACTVVGHNLGFDWKFLRRIGVRLGKVADTQIAEQVIRGVPPKGISLKALTERYIGIPMSKEEREWFFDLDRREDEWNAPFPDEQLHYMAEDVRWLDSILSQQCAELKQRKLDKVFLLEMRVLPAVAWMELNGVHIDVDGWRAVVREQEKQALELESECQRVFGPPILEWRQEKFDTEWGVYKAWEQERDEQIAAIKQAYDGTDSDGVPVKWGEYKNLCMRNWRNLNPNPGKPKLDESPPNLGSPLQLKVAFSRLGIELEVGKDGKVSTNKEALLKLSFKHPELKPFLGWRECQKNVTTYGESLLSRVERDGRIHPGFNQIGAETGRMSSHHPNWQNIPARTAVGKAFRACVTAEPGNVLLVADYSIIELRILADMSGDKNMLAMFESGMDLHSYTARKMFNLPDSMTDEEVKEYRLDNGLKARDVAKTINYGVAYGQSAFGFAAKFGVDKETAQGFIDKWYATYPEARAWLDRAGDAAVRLGYSRTVLGRKRFYHLLEPGYTWAEKKAYKAEMEAVRRAGMNAPIQGTSADITKLAVAAFYEACPDKARLVAVVHDELVVEAEEGCEQGVSLVLRDCMDRAARHFLPAVTIPSADVHTGTRWEH